MRPWIYLVAGALVAMWVSPPEGLLRYGLIVLLILGSAYLDAWWRGLRRTGGAPANVVALFGRRRTAQKPGAGGARERRGMVRVFSSPVRAEADELIQLLRAEGLRPVLVSENPMQRQAGLRFEIRIPDREAKRAQSLVELFKLRSAKNLN